MLLINSNHSPDGWTCMRRRTPTSHNAARFLEVMLGEKALMATCFRVHSPRRADSIGARSKQNTKGARKRKAQLIAVACGGAPTASSVWKSVSMRSQSQERWDRDVMWRTDFSHKFVIVICSGCLRPDPPRPAFSGAELGRMLHVRDKEVR